MNLKNFYEDAKKDGFVKVPKPVTPAKLVLDPIGERESRTP